jgi:hypothetical protein
MRSRVSAWRTAGAVKSRGGGFSVLPARLWPLPFSPWQTEQDFWYSSGAAGADHALAGTAAIIDTNTIGRKNFVMQNPSLSNKKRPQISAQHNNHTESLRYLDTVRYI